MQKIPTLFERDWDGDRSRVTRSVDPACVWVMHGTGVATRKLDGTCCLVDASGRLWKRHEVKPGREEPAGFRLVAHEMATPKIGWVPVGDGPEDQWHREALTPGLSPGTYELIGPKVNGNPEGAETHLLVAHADCEIIDAPRTYDELAAWFVDRDIEGVVWHHSDGRMAKIKGRDFGVRRPVAAKVG